MHNLDAATLQMVTAVVDLLAFLVWLLLGLVLRVAPQASLLIAATHLLLVPALWPSPAGPWGPPLTMPATLLAFTCLALAMHRLMRLERMALTPVVLAALTGLGIALLYPDENAQRALLSLGVGLLGLLAGRDILLGAGFNRPITALLALPYLWLTIVGVWRGAALLGWLSAPIQTMGSGGLALLRLTINLAITAGLFALVLQRLIARVHHLTRRDPLTGLLNRRALDEHLASLQAQVDRGSCHAVLLLDVDHFKRVNDELGHAGGDAALQHLGALLSSELRSPDVLARLGGEEFCLLLPDTHPEQAVQAAERLRRRLAAAPLLWEGKTWPLTASFGVAGMEAGDRLGHDAMQRADRALYKAKAQGRNRVIRARATAGAEA